MPGTIPVLLTALRPRACLSHCHSPTNRTGPLVNHQSVPFQAKKQKPSVMTTSVNPTCSAVMDNPSRLSPSRLKNRQATHTYPRPDQCQRADGENG